MTLLSLHKNEDGAALVEGAVTTAIVLAVVIGGILYLITFFQLSALHFAVDQATRCEIMSSISNTPNAACGNFSSYYAQKNFGLLPATSITYPSPSTVYPGNAPPNMVCVSVTIPTGLPALSFSTFPAIFVYNTARLNDTTCYPQQ